MTTIAVVTPWLDHPELADDYLAAVRPALTAADEMIVVDNGSAEPIEFAAIRLPTNHGFSKACNFGLDAATGDAVLFLNNDIRAKHPGWLAKIRAALEPGVLVGAQIRHDAHGDVDGQHLPYLDGWCLAGMRDDLLELGGWDEGYTEPAYYGDNDFCLRARVAGMRLREVRVGLHHKLGQTAVAGGDQAKTAVVAVNYARYAERARALLAGKVAA